MLSKSGVSQSSLILCYANTNSLQSCLTLCNPMDCRPLGFSIHEDSPSNNTGVGCHALLQGILDKKKLPLTTSLFPRKKIKVPSTTYSFYPLPSGNQFDINFLDLSTGVNLHIYLITCTKNF